MSSTLLDWESQRAFLAVLREGSLSAAARALGIAQPTVRRRLDALESSIGVALFTRSPSGLSPTDAARQLGAHAETMAAAADAFARAASADTEAASGTVRITASDVIGAEVLPAMLAELQRVRPGLVFELSLTNRNEDLLRHEADIAVRMVRPTQAAMVATRAGAVRLGLYARSAYLAQHGAPRTLEELGRFALIGPDRETGILAALRASGLVLSRAMFSCRTDNQLAQLGAIRAGLGIGICQQGLARRDPTLVPVLPELFAHDLDTWVTMHEDLRRVQRVRATFSHLVKALTAYCSADGDPLPPPSAA
ncbi:MAG: LysR family transcriptional regulator [Variovorax sp.]|nr:MAG: LysR family transcriptional regulator [Variovorax sp.]